MGIYLETLNALNDIDAIDIFISCVAEDPELTESEYCKLYSYAVEKVRSICGYAN